MEIRLSRKAMAALTAAVLLGTAAVTAVVNIGNVMAVDEEALNEVTEATEAVTETAEIEIEEETEAYEVAKWWKADLSSYEENLSLVSYETVEVPEEEEEETTEAAEEENEASEDYVAIEIVPSGGGSSEKPSRVESSTAAPAGSFAFTTYGYGHGVGMSQNGANHYASYSGWSYQQILGHYYPGTTIKNTGKTDATISAGGVSGSVLDIVSMVTYSEVGSSMATEAIKAQAVAAYTYIMNKGGSAGDLYVKSNPPQKVVDAVKSVLGEAVYYNGGYALTMFYASSGGSTASCSDIFYEDIPYLRSVSCEYDAGNDPHYGSVEIISADEVKSTLESRLGITLSGNPENWITVNEGAGGYAASVTIDGQTTVKGNKFRSYLGLKSANFTVSYN